MKKVLIAFLGFILMCNENENSTMLINALGLFLFAYSVCGILKIEKNKESTNSLKK